jgi:DNA helicase-2/ATP-dependent DNA helicase PcrA
MIEYSDFEKMVVNELRRDIRAEINPDQYEAINAPKDESLFIVAGPGSGKTTVMVLKVLKFIFVENIEPSEIMATTFTRKAASQLKNRITEWGNKLKFKFIADPKYFEIINDLNELNFKKITIGTIDSISEDILRKNIENTQYVIIEDFVSNSLMTKVGLLDHERQRDRQLKSFLNQIRGTKSRLNVSMMSQMLLEIKDRIYHDRIDFDDFVDNYEHPGAKIAALAISDYTEELKKRALLDFSMLEDEFLHNLQNGRLKKFLKRIKIILVDEYQDTNLLQEMIYFEIAKAAINNRGSIIVVGDDDQALYRFRGATVELFRNFAQRIEGELSVKPFFINLSKNYRSTENIVNFCNEFIQIDKGYEKARIEGKRPIISSSNGSFPHFPVLGMFREDINTLATDIASFLDKIVNGNGVSFQHENKTFNICIDSKVGSPGDIALLCSSPLELDFKGNQRLPCLLKDELSKYDPQIPIFNPRGQNLARIKIVEILCGILMECIDPEGLIQSELKGLPQNAVFRFNAWRSRALNYIKNEDNDYKFIKEFLDSWKIEYMDEEVPVIDLIYRLIRWIPEIHDPEGIVYLEVITKTIMQTSLFSDFKANIVLNSDNKRLERDSITEAIWNIFVPIAIGAINIDMDVLEDIPQNQINVMSIHQSKGLEFKIVMVDVGSDFKMNYSYDSFRRFPGTPGKSCTIEDNMGEYSPVGKPGRDGLDRAFDDLIRQYFVAFSRSIDVLMLVGLNSVKEGYFFNGEMRYIPNMATGWDRKEKWHWKGLDCLFHI